MKIYASSGLEVDINELANGDVDVNVICPPKTFDTIEESLRNMEETVSATLNLLKKEGIIGQPDKRAVQMIHSERAKAFSDRNKSKNPTIPVFTTYIYSEGYDIAYLQKAAQQAELLDRLNGITNTRVIAVTEDFFNKSNLPNPDTDLIYEIKKTTEDVSSDVTNGEAGATYSKSFGRKFQSKQFVGGFINANAIPADYLQSDNAYRDSSIQKYTATDLGIIIDHERITHGYKDIVRSLFSSGTDVSDRLQHSVLNQTAYGGDYSDEYPGIEKPKGYASEMMGNKKYTTLRKYETYSKQSIETIKDLSSYISHIKGMMEAMRLKDQIFGRLADFKSLDYGSNELYTEILNNYFKDIDFNSETDK